MRSNLFVRQVVVACCFFLLALAACAPKQETVEPATRRLAEATIIPAVTSTPTAAVPTIAATEVTPLPTATATPPATAIPQATEVPPTPWLVVPPTTAAPLPVKEEVTFSVVAQLGGTADAIALHGSIVYLGVSQRLMTVDISDPAAPRFLGQSEVLPDVVQAVAVGDEIAGGLVYVGAGRDAHIYDVSDPAAPTRISTFSSFNELEEGSLAGIIPAGELVYTVNHVSSADVFFTRLTAFDVHDPAQPVVAATRDLAGYAGVAVSGNVAYIALAHEGKVQLVDAATLNTTLGEIGWGDAVNPYFVVVTGNLAYVGMWDYRLDEEFGEHVLLAVDVSNPAQPEVVAGPIGLPGSVAGTAASGEAFFLAGAGSVHGDCPTFLQVVDIADTGPRHSTFEPQSCIKDIAVVGNTLVAATSDRGVQVFDASDRANLTLAGEFVYPPGFTRVDKIALNHDVAYIFAGETLRVLDRTQPAAPIAVGPPLVLPPDPLGLDGLYVRENKLYIVPVYNSMLVLDISEPASPLLITDTGMRSEGINWPVPGLAGNTLYRPDGDGVQIWDINDPTNPVLVNTITLAGAFFQSASVSDRYLIASGPDSTTNGVRLHLYDAGDPFQPVKVGQFQLPDPYLLVTTIANNTLYSITSDISQGNFYLYTLDLSDPAQPAAGGGFALPFGVQEMVAAGDTLYVIGSYPGMPEPPGGIWALDVSDHSQPYLAGQRQLLRNASPDVHGCRLCDLSVDGDWLYVAAGDDGLFVLQAVK